MKATDPVKTPPKTEAAAVSDPVPTSDSLSVQPKFEDLDGATSGATETTPLRSPTRPNSRSSSQASRTASFASESHVPSQST